MLDVVDNGRNYDILSIKANIYTEVLDTNKEHAANSMH